MISIMIILVLLSGGYIIQDGKVDGIYAPMTTAEFFKITEAKRTVEEGIISSEGEDYLIYRVYDADELLYTAEPLPDEYIIYRIEIYSGRFKTERGIGVGNSLGELRKAYSDINIIAEGRGINVFAEDCSIIFVLDDSKATGDIFSKETEDWEDDILIKSLRLVG